MSELGTRLLKLKLRSTEDGGSGGAAEAKVTGGSGSAAAGESKSGGSGAESKFGGTSDTGV